MLCESQNQYFDSPQHSDVPSNMQFTIFMASMLGIIAVLAGEEKFFRSLPDCGPRPILWPDITRYLISPDVPAIVR
jgi:hypothetical protein